jgi:hypothetical protein
MDYKQHSNQGCLVVDLLYLFGETPTPELEEELLSKGLFQFRDNFTVGCLLATLDKFPVKRAKLYFDNHYYLDVIRPQVHHPRVEMVCTKNDASLFDHLAAAGNPFVIYVDNHITDGYTHLPHFMLVLGASKTIYTVFDPWEGQVQKMSKRKVLEGVRLLRERVGVCPIAISCG